MKTRSTSLLIFICLFAGCTGVLAQSPHPPFAGPSVDFSHGDLRISDNHRRIVHADGTLFFWLGDTAWELFHLLTREEAVQYLEDRRSKGFNVIQAVVLADLEGLTVPNAYGAVPLTDSDPTKPVEAYFEHVDFIVNEAEKRGMYIGMLPTWGDKFNKKWGFGPEIFTPENARVFGSYLGKRYRDKQVVWILGGDRIPETENHYAIVRAMAAGIKAGDGGKHLMTFHPWGENSSSKFFHKDAWLDFNMFQSGHIARDMPNYTMATTDYNLSPPKPFVDGEPRYEDHPVKWEPANGWFDDFDVRQAAYWSVLSGAAGHTYGDNNLWQLWQPDRKVHGHARTPWYEALKHPGATQMGYLRHLMESKPFMDLRPAQNLLIDGGTGAGHLCAAMTANGSCMLIYSPLGAPIAVKLPAISGKQIRYSWFDPRTGQSTGITTMDRTNVFTFDPPGEPQRGNDWVLVIEAGNTK